MYDINKFSLKDLTECGIALRRIGDDSNTMEEAASKIVRYIFDNFKDGETNENACILARLFKTHSFENLEPKLQEFASSKIDPKLLSQTMKCLTLLGTAGTKDEWNSRDNSNGHKAIPLPSKEVVNSIPMIINLVKQLGLDLEQVLSPDPKIIMDIEQKSYNIFFLEDAHSNPYVPAQEEFVIPNNVKTVIGFGGILPSGNMFVIILFTKVKLAKEIAEMFSSLALNVKMSLLPFEDAVFNES